MKLVEQLADKYAKQKSKNETYQQYLKEAFIEGWYALNHEIGGLHIFDVEVITNLEEKGILVHEIVPRILNDIDILTEKTL